MILKKPHITKTQNQMKLRKILLTAAFALTAIGSQAQDMSQLMQPLPVDPKVRVGHLDNGLT